MGKKILIVDDEESIRELLGEHLEEQGHTVDAADNGIECGVKLFENQYDVVLMDLHMPKMDGFKSIKYLKNGLSEKNKAMKIIVVTGYSPREHEQTFKELGIPVLRKPVNLDELERIINEN